MDDGGWGDQPLTLVARPLPSAWRGRGRPEITVLVLGDERPKPVQVRLVVGAGAFDLARVRPVFEVPAARTYAAAVFDEPLAAVGAISWALDRHSAGLADFRWDAGA